MHGRIALAHLPLRGEELLDGHVEVLAAGGVQGEGPPQGLLHRELHVRRLPRVDGLVADALRLAPPWRLLWVPGPSAAATGRTSARRRRRPVAAEPPLVLPSHLDHNAVAGEPVVAAPGEGSRRRRQGAPRRRERRQRDVAPAEGASRAALQPGVDAVDVEGVGAVGQQADALPLHELAQAHGALRHGYPRRQAAGVITGRSRELDDGEHADERQAEAPPGVLGR